MCELFSYLFFISFAYLTLQALQIKLLNKSTHDHNAHLHLIYDVRKSGWPLPPRPTAIINPSSWGGNPIFFHYLIGKFPDKFIDTIAWFQAPFFILITSLVLFATFNEKLDSNILIIIYALILFNPSNFDISNAKNFGFSSRPAGQFLVICHLCLMYLLNFNDDLLWFDLLILLLTVLTGVGAIAMNVFAAQVLIIFSLGSIFFGNYIPITFLTLSFIQSLGRNCDKLEVVIQAAAFVFKETSLYLLECKKVISF